MHKAPFIFLCALLLLGTGCRETFYLTTAQLAPESPHVVFKSGDTLYAEDVQISNKPFLKNRIRADAGRFPEDSIRYALTSKFRKLVPYRGAIYEQVVAGRLNAYGAYIPHVPGVINGEGRKRTATEAIDKISLLQSAPDEKFYPYDLEAMKYLMRSDARATGLLAKAQKADAAAHLSLATGLLVGGAGLVTAMYALVSSGPHSQTPDPERLAMIGLAGMGTGGLLLTIPYPHYRLRTRRYKYAAIDAYNGY